MLSAGNRAQRTRKEISKTYMSIIQLDSTRHGSLRVDSPTAKETTPPCGGVGGGGGGGSSCEGGGGRGRRAKECSSHAVGGQGGPSSNADGEHDTAAVRHGEH